MKYAILFAALFDRNTTEKEGHLKKRVIRALQNLISIFGVPSEKLLEEEITPLSKRYDYVFRYKHIKNLIDKL